MKAPPVVIRPILLPSDSVNHSAPSGPAVMLYGAASVVGIVNSEKVPPVVIRPILLAVVSANHSAPSGPVVMPHGSALFVGVAYSLKSDAEAVPAPPQNSAAAIEAGIARRPQIPAIGHWRAMLARVRPRRAAFNPFMTAPAKNAPLRPRQRVAKSYG